MKRSFAQGGVEPKCGARCCLGIRPGPGEYSVNAGV